MGMPKPSFIGGGLTCSHAPAMSLSCHPEQDNVTAAVGPGSCCVVGMVLPWRCTPRLQVSYAGRARAGVRSAKKAPPKRGRRPPTVVESGVRWTRPPSSRP